MFNFNRQKTNRSIKQNMIEFTDQSRVDITQIPLTSDVKDFIKYLRKTLLSLLKQESKAKQFKEIILSSRNDDVVLTNNLLQFVNSHLHRKTLLKTSNFTSKVMDQDKIQFPCIGSAPRKGMNIKTSPRRHNPMKSKLQRILTRKYDPSFQNLYSPQKVIACKSARNKGICTKTMFSFNRVLSTNKKSKKSKNNQFLSKLVEQTLSRVKAVLKKRNLLKKKLYLDIPKINKLYRKADLSDLKRENKRNQKLLVEFTEIIIDQLKSKSYNDLKKTENTSFKLDDFFLIPKMELLKSKSFS